MTVMFEDGIEKTLRGITTLDEVFRVSKKAE
jgi:type II secretory ATPase GspE/PulE/Tfp pilus assembly ATPase PilB-like protein